MPDMSQLLAQAQQMQEQLVAAKDQLAEEHVVGSAANGLVNATVTGTGDLVSVDIKPAAVDPDDTETLGDMIVAAVRDASDKANDLAAERLGPLAGGFGEGGPELPGGTNPLGFQ
ncbi:YbaB/EbfC family nucleoid-associated protein [Solicola gregarius]|uniref:Nucleoid-associated protein L0C25_11765 n=1 Tax=Solicola gregarius TaxID=2908642 RepID=A0AA46YNK1_9ACTN|nr:YbaB/EbfC family nucleoid-associated protein [Solicola gregarius]UYM07709.1 YbaB/EbfC family nucleoid-associated protein [Solicola gregarius]